MAITKTGVQIDVSSSFSNPTVFEQNGRVTSINVNNLAPSQRYYVRGYVISDGTTVYSQNFRSFDTLTPNYLNFTNISGNTVHLELKKVGSPADIDLEYSTDDGTTWDSFNSGNGDLDVELADGEKVMLRGTNATFSETASDYFYFTSDEMVEAAGNIMTLVDEFGMLDTIPCDYCFANLFFDMGGMENAGLELPATTLTEYCYMNTFKNCSNMIRPVDLPADSLAEGCYYGTYSGCQALESSPDLVAPVLVPYCYEEMFYECLSLNEIMCHAEEWDATNTRNWVYGVPQSGTIYLFSGITVGTGTGEIPADDPSGCPLGWAIDQSL